MKTILQKILKPQLRTPESIYYNKGVAADAFHFSLIEPQRKRVHNTIRIFEIFTLAKRFPAKIIYSAILLLWFSVYFLFVNPCNNLFLKNLFRK